MELILAEYTLRSPGGAQTYIATVASHLEQLGHRVTLLTLDDGPFAEALRAGGLRVGGLDSLPDRCDAILTQDGVCAYELAARHPRTPQLYVLHSAEYAIELPPQVAGTIGAIVALNDRTARRAAASGAPVPVVRLRQPVDFLRFGARRYARERPRQAVLLGNALKGPRRELLVSALDEAGIDWRQPGASGEGITLTPEDAVAGADVVIGYGRSVLEGMSAGCAAYVYDLALDGWVTPESYPAIEADGFAGTATGGAAARERLAADLAAYDPAMGVAARELVVTNHSPFTHATALAEVLQRLVAGAEGGLANGVGDAAGELARLTRRQWETERRAGERAHHLNEHVAQLRREADVLMAERATLTAAATAAQEDAHRRAVELGRAADDLSALWERTHAAEAELARLRSLRRYRVLARAMRPIDRAHTLLRGLR